jgi:cellulase/cellobiase CelA1
MDKNWGSGAILELQVTNTGDTDVTNWQVAFDFADLEIESIWRAEVSVTEDGRFIVDGIHSSDDLDAGETVRIGMKVSDGDLDIQALNQAADFDLFL